MRTKILIILLFLSQFGAAQYDKYYHSKDKTLEDSFSEFVRDVPVSGLLYCVIEVKKGEVEYTYFGKKELLTDEVLRFFKAIKSNWNRKAIRKEKLLLPIYMIKYKNDKVANIDLKEIMQTSVPPNKYILLKYLGIYNTIIDE